MPHSSMICSASIQAKANMATDIIQSQETTNLDYKKLSPTSLDNKTPALRRLVGAVVYDYLACLWIATIIALPFKHTVFRVSQELPLPALAISLFLFRDCFFQGRGIGRHLFKMQVVDRQGRPASNLQLISRNLILVTPFLLYQLWPAGKDTALMIMLTISAVELILITKKTGRRLADRLTGTRIIMKNGHQ